MKRNMSSVPVLVNTQPLLHRHTPSSEGGALHFTKQSQSRRSMSQKSSWRLMSHAPNQRGAAYQWKDFVSPQP